MMTQRTDLTIGRDFSGGGGIDIRIDEMFDTINAQVSVMELNNMYFMDHIKWEKTCTLFRYFGTNQHHDESPDIFHCRMCLPSEVLEPENDVCHKCGRKIRAPWNRGGAYGELCKECSKEQSYKIMDRLPNSRFPWFSKPVIRDEKDILNLK